MKKIQFLIVLFSISCSFAQDNIWKKTSEKEISLLSKMDRASMPSEYQLFSINLQSLKNQLLSAPLDTENNSNVFISFPNADGILESFKIFEAPIMEKGLSDKFPDIKSYIGKGVDDKTATIRFSITLFGLHTMTFSGNSETTYIDTFTKDLNNYIVYKRSNISRSRNFECLTKNTQEFALDNQVANPTNILRASDGKFRVFRLAMASTIEYSAYHISAANALGIPTPTLISQKAVVLAAMGVTMTRVNGIYEKDMSLRMNLIANNNLIIFVDSDNFSNDDAELLINESQSQITSIIGSANFDIGHTVSTGGGGLAGPAPCSSNSKANGITGASAPVGDAYDVDYVAHEMGHQFGSFHTFRNSCGGNVDPSTAVEPGSGSTIMAYAGICAPNVQNFSDAYFHSISIAQMVAQINGVSNCAAFTNNGNAAPIANAGLNYTIPKGTAYVLQGSATDSNNPNTLTYCWEGTDVQSATQPPTQTATGGPNFRSFSPTTSPNRYMPKLSSVVAGVLNPTWEVISNVARTQNFSLTVRDNAALQGGQTGRDDMVLTVNATAGPFAVTSQNSTGISWAGLSSQTITWNVAGSTSNGVNTAFVNILLSTDNGLTFSTPLIANTPNDGTETINIPNNINSTTCRLMVQAVDNIFYAVNSRTFSVSPNLASDSFGFENFVLAPNPNNGSFKISFNSDSNTDVKININDIRGRRIFDKSFENNGLFNQDLKLNNIQSGIYLVTILNGNYKTVKRIVVE
jgi:Metallo-peptidase family M12B Reprolysin-like/Secretion system C-terminal sorting domain